MHVHRVLLIAVAAVLSPAAVAHADTWSSPRAVPHSTGPARPVQLLFSPAGRTAVIALGSYDRGAEVLRSEQLGTGAFPAFRPAFTGTAREGVDRIAYDARGDGVAAGLYDPRHGPTILALRATRRPGSTMGPRQAIDEDVQSDTLRLAIGDHGDAIVSWVALIHGRQRVAYVLRRAGHRFGARRLLSWSAPTGKVPPIQVQPVPAVDERGTIALAWADRTHQRVAVGTVRRGLVRSQDLGKVVSGPVSSAPVALSLRGGRGVLALVENMGHLQTAVAATSSNVARGFGALSYLSYVTGTSLGVDVDPAAAVLADGSFAVTALSIDVYRLDAWTAGPDGIFGTNQVLNPQGVTAGTPSLAAGPSGGALIAFGGGHAGAIFAASLPARSRTFSSADLVATQEHLIRPVAGMGAGGRAGVMWSGGPEGVQVSLRSAG